VGYVLTEIYASLGDKDRGIESLELEFKEKDALHGRRGAAAGSASGLCTSPVFGGLRKTGNRGVSFTPIFDEGPSFTLCCVVIDPNDPDVLWLGTGENKSQPSANFGDGVYKPSMPARPGHARASKPPSTPVSS
jgi:hypothetical protein